MRPRIGRTVALLLLLAALPGCGGCTGTVAGRVTVRGAPVSSAEVVFTGADGVPFSANTDADGHYRLTRLPPGEMKIRVVSAMAPSGAGPVKLPEAPPKPIPQAPTVPLIPRRYEDPDNGLKYTVQPGAQTHDIELGP